MDSKFLASVARHSGRSRPIQLARNLLQVGKIKNIGGLLPRLKDTVLQRGESFGCVADRGGYILILHARRRRGRIERFQGSQR